MSTIKKIEIINDAYSQMRISGITVQPSPEDVTAALIRLEGFAAELEDSEVCTGYNFVDAPDPDDDSGITAKNRQGFATVLAMRLVSDFGKEIPTSLKLAANAGLSGLMSRNIHIPGNDYPARQPRGSGNTLRWNRWRRYYVPPEVSSPSCAVNHMRVDEVNDYVESWKTYLDSDAGETIDSYTYELTPACIELSNVVLDSPDISFRAKAIKAGSCTVKFTVTTSEGRVDVRNVLFEVSQ